jgi:hypothetical protein
MDYTCGLGTTSKKTLNGMLQMTKRMLIHFIAEGMPKRMTIRWDVWLDITDSMRSDDIHIMVYRQRTLSMVNRYSIIGQSNIKIIIWPHTLGCNSQMNVMDLET